MRWLILPLLAWTLGPGAGTDHSPIDHVRLGADAAELREAFNRDRGRVRLVLGVSPTCGSCLRRARTTQRSILEEFETGRLVAHVVWIPTHGARERHVDEAADLVPDRRATHYWDPAGAFMRLLEEPLSSRPGDAEGVVLVYGPDAEWTGRIPPVPLAWAREARDVRRLERVVGALLRQ